MKIFFILFLSVYIFAFEASIVKVDRDIVSLDRNIKKGMSGVVLCPYMKKRIICASAISLGNKEAKLGVYDNLENRAFALPIVYPKPKDKIIFGKNYNRVVIIAPNQFSYLKIKEDFKTFTIIPVDVFAAFLNKLPTRDDFVKFAKSMDVGLYIFALKSYIYLVDANSFYVIDKKRMEIPQKFKLPFYSSYNFDIKEKDIVNYYKKMLRGFND